MLNISAIMAEAEAIKTLFGLATSLVGEADTFFPKGSPLEAKIALVHTFMEGAINAEGVAEASVANALPVAKSMATVWVTAAHNLQAATAALTAAPAPAASGA